MADEGEERNLPPSAQKLSRARQEGNIARSPELSMACGLFFAFICLIESRTVDAKGNY